jgi:SAM-dependent methyltransferase
MVYRNESSCRACGSQKLEVILSYGETPLADRLLTADQLQSEEVLVPLTLVFCHACSLVQIRETVEPSILFYSDYPYFSSVSPSLLKHFTESAQQIIESRPLNGDSLVIEAASNDGYMLKEFLRQGVPVLGIDPSEAPVRIAQAAGVDTLCTFFTKDLAQQLRDEGKLADVFLANNVLAHVADLNGFVEGIKLVLKETGLAVLEMHYVVSMIDHCEFDTVYHQHMCNFSVTSLDRLFRKHGLFINAAERIPTYGGSLRVFVEHHESPSESVKSLLREESERGVDGIGYFKDFAARALQIKKDAIELLQSLKTQGCHIAGYGAAAKATTFITFLGIDSGLIEYIADLNEFKQGRYLSHFHIPIVPPQKLVQDKPDYTIIMAWNFAEEIIRQQREYQEQGGKFIIPIPEVRVV